MNQPCIAPQKGTAAEKASAPTRAALHVEPPRETPSFVNHDNQAMQTLLRNRQVQAQLAISQPDDPDEQEADRVAEQIMRDESPASIGAASAASRSAVHRTCAACSAGGTTCPTCAAEGTLQRQAGSGNPHAAHGSHGSQPASPSRPNLRALQGGGQPLAGPIRAFFEPHFGVDLASVRVHTDHSASQAAGAIDALAFTLGPDIAFARNQFAPETPAGKRLLAHELTHVVQQSHAVNPQRIARDPGTQVPTVSGRPPAVPVPAPASALAAPPVPVPTSATGPSLSPAPFGQPVACYAPKGDTMTFEGVLLAANTGYLNGELRDYIAKHGEDGATAFRIRLRQYVGVQMQKDSDYDVDDPASLVGMNVDTTDTLKNQARISLAVDTTLTTILADNRRWLADFEAKANAVVLGMLQDSEDRVNQERIRYGISWEQVERTAYRQGRNGPMSYKTPGTEYSMQDTPGSRALAEAATGLLARKRTFDTAHADMTAYGESIYGALGEMIKDRLGAGNDKEMTHLNALRAVRNQAKRDLDVFRTQKSAEFPILAAYASEAEISEKSLEKIEQMASGKSPPATAMIGEEIKTRLEHIADVRKDIQENGGKDTKIWRVPRIIEGTRTITDALPGTMYGRLVDDKVKDEAPGFWTGILLGLLQLALVLLAPVSGGLTLIPAAAISVGQAYAQFQEYERAQMLHGTDFGAMSLSAEDPSMFWLAVAIIGAGLDAGAAAGAAFQVFRALAPAARAARAAQTEEAFLALERAAKDLGGEALATAVGHDARAGSEAMHVGETAAEAGSLERAGAQMAENELKGGFAVAESTAGRTVKVSKAGGLWSCASPCTILRERYKDLLLKKGNTWEARLKILEDEAAAIPKGPGEAAARQGIAERAAALEKEIRIGSPEILSLEELETLVKLPEFKKGTPQGNNLRYLRYQKKAGTMKFDEWERNATQLWDNSAKGTLTEEELQKAMDLGLKNTETMSNKTGTVSFIPDHVGGFPEKLNWGEPYHFSEIKDWKDMSDTGNLKAMLDYVDNVPGSSITIYYKSSTRMTGPLIKKIDTLRKAGKAELIPFVGRK